jgi:hypothetical protein
MGDVNGDGLGDIMVCATERDTGGVLPHPPRVRVAFGAPGKYPDLSNPDQFFENDVLGFNGKDRYYSGFWATLLDVNNDGAEDMLWVPYRDSLWIMYGGPTGLSGTVDRIFPNHDPDRWRSSFQMRHHRIGDFNGDGYNDYMLNYGADGYPAMVVVGGDANGMTNEPLQVCVAGGQYGGRMVVDIGDLNGDGCDEYVISDPISPIPDLYYQPGFAAIIRGQSWLVLGTDDERESFAPIPEPFTVEVYPAPSNGDVQIIVRTDQPGVYTVAVYSLEGKLLFQRGHELRQHENVLVLQKQDLPQTGAPAVLLIRIEHNGKTVQKKLIRE